MAIKVTPEELEAMASSLQGQANQALALADAISKAIDMGTAAWEGNAQKDYVARFEQIKPVLTQELPDLINSMASNAVKRAAAYREADKV